MADSTKRIPRVINDSEVESCNTMDRLILAKASKEEALARQAQLELDIAEKHLVIRSEVEKIGFEVARGLRDRINSTCIKVAPVVSNMDSPEKITKYLKDQFNDQLRIFIDEFDERINTD